LTDAGPAKKLNKKKIGIIIGVVVLLVAAAMTIVIIRLLHKDDPPADLTAIKLSITDGAVMKLGTSRVLEVMFFSGHDDRTSNDFKVVPDKSKTWEVTPPGIISIDTYGRI
jgi:flagellar basal body-associated protein FliL